MPAKCSPAAICSTGSGAAATPTTTRPSRYTSAGCAANSNRARTRPNASEPFAGSDTSSTSPTGNRPQLTRQPRVHQRLEVMGQRGAGEGERVGNVYRARPAGRAVGHQSDDLQPD